MSAVAAFSCEVVATLHKSIDVWLFANYFVTRLMVQIG